MSYYVNKCSNLPTALDGEQYGYWTVLDECCKTPKDYSEKHYRGYTYWKCRCVCGTERFVREYDLTNGKSKSCGCKRGELYKKTIAENYLKNK